MGWASGSRLLGNIIETLEDSEVVTKLDDAEIQRIYFNIIVDFSNYDCDTFDECVGMSKHYDLAFREFYGISDAEWNERYGDDNEND